MIINMNGAKAPETPSPVLQEKTVTPETLPTVIGADEGYDGLSQVTVNPDSQLKAENIRSGKTIFGVNGTFVGETQTVYETVDTVRYALENRQTLVGNARPMFTTSGVAKTRTTGVSQWYWDTNSSAEGARYMYKGKLTYIPKSYYSKTSYSTGYGNKFHITADSLVISAVEIYTCTNNDVDYPEGTSFNISLKGFVNGNAGKDYARGRTYGFDEVSYSTTATNGWTLNKTGFNQINFTFDTPWTIENVDIEYCASSSSSDSDISLGFTITEMKADVIG